MNVLAFGMPGPMELTIIAVIAVLIFGKRLPSIARSVGSSFVEFKRGIKHGIEDAKEPFEDAKRQMEGEAKEIERGLRG